MRRIINGEEKFHATDPYRDMAISLLMDSMRYVVKHAIPDEPVEHQARGVIKELLFLSHGLRHQPNPQAYHELANCTFLLGKSPYEILHSLLSAYAAQPKLLDYLGMDTRGARQEHLELTSILLTHKDRTHNG